jgi:signal transduction histidine kinase
MRIKHKEQLVDELTTMRQRIAELEEILEISCELTSALALEPLLKKILATAAELTDGEGASVLLRDTRTDELRFIAAFGAGSEEVMELDIPVPIEGSIAGTVFTSREPLIVPDLQADPRHYGEVDRQTGFVAHSVLGVPLQLANRCIGVLEAVNKRGDQGFSQEDVKTLTVLAAQAAIAIENARLFEAEQRRRQEAETLYRAAQALATTLDLRQVFESILSELQQVVPYDSASVQMLEGEGLVIIGGHGFSDLDGLVGMTFDPKENNPNREVIRRRASFIVDDAPAVYPIFHTKPHAAANIRAWLGVPLLFGDQLIGMLTLDKREPGFYTQEHARLAEAFATQAAIAIKNAQLYEAVVDHVEQLEERVRERTVELRARNEELAAYDHTVAHDLKNPLALVTGYVEVLEEDYTTMSEEELQQSLRAIAKSGRKMRSIIDELLLLSGVRDMEVEMVLLDMASIVAEAQHRLTPMIEEHNADIILPDASAWPVALGYGPWVEEVWVNYLSNAIKYGGRPPRVELGTVEQADGRVRFWVRDNGPGIPAEEQTRLFSRFTRLDQDRAEGHGLGLSIVQRIVEKLGGQVWVESEVGQGSTFIFSLPGTSYLDQV